MAQQGLFVPAEEKERIRELQILINNLNIRTHLFANTVSNFTPVTAYLPYDREKVTNELQFASLFLISRMLANIAIVWHLIR